LKFLFFNKKFFKGFNAGSSSSLLTNNAVEICSPPSASTIRTQSRMQQNNSIESCVTQNTSNIYQTVSLKFIFNF